MAPLHIPASRSRWNHGMPLIIDSFAGGGGASTGIEMALGRSPDLAINHNPQALALHAANHPDTVHLSENIYCVDPLDYVAGQHIGLAWFSPDCKHFSKAKGGKPVERNIRDLAHVIPFWVERIQKSGGKIDVIAMENVEEFSTWGPLLSTDKGEFPDPARKGETFQKWCKQLRKLGGKLEKRELRACDYGAPTIRKRLFVIIRFDGRPIVWPKPTHGKPSDRDVIAGRKLPWRTAAECIDWSIPCPSVFDTSAQILEKHGLKSIRPLADNTMARVARGMKRYVLDAERPFLVNLTHGGRVEDLAEPFKTVTGANRGEKAVVSPSLVSVAHGDSGGRREYPLTEPFGVVTAGGISHAVIVPHLSAFYGPGDGGLDRSAPVDEPVRVIPCENRHAMIAPSLIRFNTGATGSDLREPVPTITANSFIKKPGGAAPLGIIAPVLSAAQHGGSIRPVDTPHHTITASLKDQNSVIIPTLVGCGGRAGQSRPRSVDEPCATMTAKADVCMASVFIAQQNNDSRREGGVNPGRSADEPLSTITQTGSHQSVVSAFVARQFGTSTGHAIDEPSATVMADGAGKSQLVTPFLQAYYGTGDGGEENQPMRTVTTKDRHGHVEAALDVPPFTVAQEGRARQVAEFMRAHGFWDDREFVTLDIAGHTFVIVDIGMRMLAPRELYNAQGFPADYVIAGVWVQPTVDHNGAPVWLPFPKSVQVSCVGNSVSPPVAEAIIAANCDHLVVRRVAA
ncbi:DNA cytosine methyltransferase [Rhizobium skierniewicense]|uniref:DNA cytosine methyltransferase n=1 Tax=Rhizobium skierniewicense TaxID=984260 RepID=UPI001573005E|nr:DNA cytosine methyltransferase [Rhizobium skierniewicense]NTF32322.1 C-5 cytosine-specific DNA methylase [Rhizobium skierniewicense]